MILRDHTTPENSARRTSAFEIVFLGDETEPIDPTAFDTKPLDTPALDEQIDDLIRFGERLDAVDTEGTDDDRL
jgi:hypothetical protein